MRKATIILISLMIVSFAILSVNALDIKITPVSPYDTSVETPPQKWYEDAYKFVVNETLMTNSVIRREQSENGSYSVVYVDFLASNPITRSEIATIISRYNGSYDTIESSRYLASTAPAFVDVPDGQWYTPAAQWAYENGIVNGVGGAYFAPDRTITREEFATMLYRYTEYLEVDTSARVDYSDFADSGSVSDWATDAMSWAVAEGLISGKPGKLLAPQDTITRAEVATVIYRYNNEVKAHRDIWDGSIW